MLLSDRHRAWEVQHVSCRAAVAGTWSCTGSQESQSDLTWVRSLSRPPTTSPTHKDSTSAVRSASRSWVKCPVFNRSSEDSSSATPTVTQKKVSTLPHDNHTTAIPSNKVIGFSLISSLLFPWGISKQSTSSNTVTMSAWIFPFEKPVPRWHGNTCFVSHY